MSASKFLLPPDRIGRIYLSGPMTGIPDFNFPAFNAAAESLRAQGFHVENPADHGVVDGAEWGDYLRHDIARLVTCEAIALLPGWERSRGARFEREIADRLNMRTIYLEFDRPEKVTVRAGKGNYPTLPIRLWS